MDGKVTEEHAPASVRSLRMPHNQIEKDTSYNRYCPTLVIILIHTVSSFEPYHAIVTQPAKARLSFTSLVAAPFTFFLWTERTLPDHQNLCRMWAMSLCHSRRFL